MEAYIWSLQKLELVLKISLLVTGASKKATLEPILCIHYSIQFWRDKIHNVLALINLKSEVNAMSPAYTQKLGF